MSKLYSGQLFSVLLLSGIWTILCIPELSAGTLTGIAAAALLQAILLLPALLCTGKGIGITSWIRQHKWVGWVYVLCFLLWGAYGFEQLRQTADRVSLPRTSSMVVITLIILVCLYTSSLGLKALARSAPFVLGILVISILILLIGAMPRLDTVRFALRLDGAWEGGLFYFCTSGELAAAVLLLEHLPHKQNRTLLGFLGAKAVFAGMIVFLCICVCGRLLSLEEFPFFTLTALSQPLRSQRADALYLILFDMLFIIRMALQTGVTAHLLQILAPRIRKASFYALSATLVLSLLLDHSENTALLLCGGTLILTAFVVPLILYLKRRNPHEASSAPAPAAPSADDGMRQGHNQ